ncbi:MAG: hypothetical protein AB7O59_13850 [Pirellulales bacterium]
MLRHIVLAGSALALVLSMTASASAQFGRGFSIPPIVQDIMMMNTAEVQKELTLSPDQTKSITDIAKQMQAEAMEIMSGLQDLTPEERQEELPKVMEMIVDKAKDLQTKVDGILDDKQTGRVKELSLQRRGVEALSDDEVIAALKLTDEQKKNLSDLRDEAGAKQQELFQSFSGANRDEIREKMMALRKEMGDKALAVLTTEQRDAFDKMKGAKFEFPRQRGFGF